jgi:PAS domain S-box-containing protein
MENQAKTNAELLEENSILKQKIKQLQQLDTERKRAEFQKETALEALRETDSKYRNILENIQDGYFELDLAGNYTFVNETNCRFLGYTKEEVVGMNFRQHTDEENAEKLYQPYYELYRTGKPIESLEVESIRKDGTKVLNETSVSLIRNSEGKAIGFRGLSRDVTERRQMEEMVRRSEERYRTILDEMAEGYFEVDLAGNFTFANDADCRLLGYSREELIGTNYRSQAVQQDIEILHNAFSNIYKTGKSERSISYTAINKDGTTGIAEISAFPMHNKKKEIIGFRGIARDITLHKQADDEKRSLEERLNRAEKMEALGQLAGGVAHDLNNVLGVLTGYSELLLMEVPEGQRARNYVEKILNSTEKGAAIIQDLLTLARRGVTVSEVINLNSVVSGFLKTPVIEKIKDYHPRITFKMECDKNLLNVKGSPVHLEKTLMNLVSNAAESISAKGEVTIRTESRYLDKPISGYDKVKEGDYAVLTVSDTGMGIPIENREKIFEPFYTKKTMGRSGTGLGLAIVWGTVKDHNGYIDVQSEIDKGTTFSLYFPVTREELIEQQKKKPIELYMGSGECVLVVDDIAEQRDIASRLLTQLGYEVQVVASGEAAVEYLKGNKADILVLDMIMAPGIDGLETYQRALEVNPKQKAILVSGFSETDRVREAQKLGAGVYVKKPYVMEKIGVAIRDELNR